MSVPNSADAEALGRAQRLIEEALEIIDKTNAPGDIAAHIDLGLHRLKLFLDASITPN